MIQSTSNGDIDKSSDRAPPDWQTSSSNNTQRRGNLWDHSRLLRYPSGHSIGRWNANRIQRCCHKGRRKSDWETISHIQNSSSAFLGRNASNDLPLSVNLTSGQRQRKNSKRRESIQATNDICSYPPDPWCNLMYLWRISILQVILYRETSYNSTWNYTHWFSSQNNEKGNRHRSVTVIYSSDSSDSDNDEIIILYTINPKKQLYINSTRRFLNVPIWQLYLHKRLSLGINFGALAPCEWKDDCLWLCDKCQNSGTMPKHQYGIWSASMPQLEVFVTSIQSSSTW